MAFLETDPGYIRVRHIQSRLAMRKHYFTCMRARQ
jgi:hypothetical protein